MALPAPAADAHGPRAYLARCLRGTEWILAAEIETRLSPTTITLAHRSVRFTTDSPPPLASLSLATADDVFLVVADVTGIDRTRAGLAYLRARAHELPWGAALAGLKRLRPQASWRAATVTASHLGRRNYNRYEIEAAVAEAASEGLGLQYRPSRSPQPHTPELALRVHLEGTRATVAARIFDTPLHRRSYKLTTCSGTLHPPLAAAMALIAGLRPGSRVLDPFTGVGTIPIEAGRLQPRARVIGSDIDAERIRGASSNARLAGASATFQVEDAAALPWRRASFTHVVSNVPWQRAVGLRGRLASASSARDEEIARVLAYAGRAVLLVDQEDPLVTRNDVGNGMRVVHRSWLSAFGQHPRLCILARGGEGGDGPIDAGAPWGPALGRWVDKADTLEP